MAELEFVWNSPCVWGQKPHPLMLRQCAASVFPRSLLQETPHHAQLATPLIRKWTILWLQVDLHCHSWGGWNFLVFKLIALTCPCCVLSCSYLQICLSVPQTTEEPVGYTINCCHRSQLDLDLEPWLQGQGLTALQGTSWIDFAMYQAS